MLSMDESLHGQFLFYTEMDTEMGWTLGKALSLSVIKSNFDGNDDGDVSMEK